MTAGLDPIVVSVARAGLALLFIHAALHKLRDLDGFRAALAAYQLLPESTTATAAPLLVGVEIALAVSLPFPSLGAAPALAAAALLAIYAAAIAINLGRGRGDIGCGCAGRNARMTLSPELVGRNLVLVTIALLASRPAYERAVGWLDGVTFVAALLTFGLLYAAAEVAIGARTSRPLPAPASGAESLLASGR